MAADAPLVFMGPATQVTALQEQRRQAPGRVQAAERTLAGNPEFSVTTKILEGKPDETIVQEATDWKADLVVVGAHGYGMVQRLLLGSVSQAVALHAPCSVEIVRCPEVRAA